MESVKGFASRNICLAVISQALVRKMAEACGGLVLTGLPYFYAGATASGCGTVQVTVRQGIDYLGADVDLICFDEENQVKAVYLMGTVFNLFHGTGGREKTGRIDKC